MNHFLSASLVCKKPSSNISNLVMSLIEEDSYNLLMILYDVTPNHITKEELLMTEEFKDKNVLEYVIDKNIREGNIEELTGDKDAPPSLKTGYILTKRGDSSVRKTQKILEKRVFVKT